MKVKHPFIIALFVNFTIPLGGMSTDIYLPSLPSMATFFDTTPMMVQLTVTLFALGLGIGQAVAGPISDALGRRRPFLFGLILQLIAVIVILTLHSASILIIARLFQGFGSAFMMVPARAILNDTFEGDALKKQYTYITAAFALGPIVAPFIGGYLEHYFGWHANFIFILVYLVVLFLFMLLFIEESIEKKRTFSIAHITSSYLTVLENKLFLTGGILVSFFLGYVAIFNVVGPFIIQDILGKSAVYYGYVALIMGAAWFSGNMASRLFFNYSRHSKTNIILVIMLLAAIMMLLLSLGQLTVLKLLIPIFILIFGGGFLFPIYVGECLSIFRAQAASANGLLFALIWCVFSLFSFIGTCLKVHALMPLAVCYLVVTILVYLWFYLIAKKH
ncbi:MFS transporter [Thiotrichales bacterium 19S3-7]|nr:MFS transporter [Thiotrichales bacterium 19S3-7]MCF6801132.1 MFS transporter [Thiotrichales bacterium 19S3-11]